MDSIIIIMAVRAHKKVRLGSDPDTSLVIRDLPTHMNTTQCGQRVKVRLDPTQFGITKIVDADYESYMHCMVFCLAYDADEIRRNKKQTDFAPAITNFAGVGVDPERRITKPIVFIGVAETTLVRPDMKHPGYGKEPGAVITVAVQGLTHILCRYEHVSMLNAFTPIEWKLHQSGMIYKRLNPGWQPPAVGPVLSIRAQPDSIKLDVLDPHSFFIDKEEISLYNEDISLLAPAMESYLRLNTEKMIFDEYDEDDGMHGPKIQQKMVNALSLESILCHSKNYYKTATRVVQYYLYILTGKYVESPLETEIYNYDSEYWCMRTITTEQRENQMDPRWIWDMMGYFSRGMALNFDNDTVTTQVPSKTNITSVMGGINLGYLQSVLFPLFEPDSDDMHSQYGLPTNNYKDKFKNLLLNDNDYRKKLDEEYIDTYEAMLYYVDYKQTDATNVDIVRGKSEETDLLEIFTQLDTYGIEGMKAMFIYNPILIRAFNTHDPEILNFTVRQMVTMGTNAESLKNERTKVEERFRQNDIIGLTMENNNDTLFTGARPAIPILYQNNTSEIEICNTDPHKQYTYTQHTSNMTFMPYYFGLAPFLFDFMDQDILTPEMQKTKLGTFMYHVQEKMDKLLVHTLHLHNDKQSDSNAYTQAYIQAKIQPHMTKQFGMEISETDSRTIGVMTNVSRGANAQEVSLTPGGIVMLNN